MEKNKNMVVYKEGIIIKIINFFKNLFIKKDKKIDNEEILVETKEQNIVQKQKENHFFRDIHIDADKIVNIGEKKAFLEEINGNTKALNMLSMDRLKKLETYYDNIIKQNDAKIKKLKREESN